MISSVRYWFLVALVVIVYVAGMFVTLFENDSAQFAVMAMRMVQENDLSIFLKDPKNIWTNLICIIGWQHFPLKYLAFTIGHIVSLVFWPRYWARTVVMVWEDCSTIKILGSFPL